MCELSKIDISEEYEQKLVIELSEILNYIGELSGVDTDGVEPLSHVFPVTDVMRDDVVKESYDRSLILKNAPCHNEECFVVPRSVEQEAQ